MRSASSCHTGVRPSGSGGSLPRSMWLSSGLWKSLPREAARPNSRGSDFHSPDESHIDLGKLPPLPDGLTPVWQLLAGRVH